MLILALPCPFFRVASAAEAQPLPNLPAGLDGGVNPAEVFACTFKTNLATPWRIVGGKWEVRDDCLWQTQAGLDDPGKAVLVLEKAAARQVMITAKMRLDQWNNGEWARAGVSCCSDPQTGRGLNLVFHQGQLKFMRDYVAWGPACPFPSEIGQWYWIRLYREAEELKGKAWRDGEPEPADWMVVWSTNEDGLTGYPALVGCSGNASAGEARVSFAQCSVLAMAGAPAAAYRWKDANLFALKRAVDDLTQTCGTNYPNGPAYLRRIAELERAVAEARGPNSNNVDFARLAAAAEQFEALRAEALLANPLLDFDRLLLVKRRDARKLKPQPPLQMPFPNDPIAHLEGLPCNFQGNTALRLLSFENEIAVLSPVRPNGRLSTLFRPEKPVFVGDLKLHFDADRLLFSSLGSHDRFQIFEIEADGRQLRQVTRGTESDVDNYDACYLPDDRILFGSSAGFQAVPCERRVDEVANLFVMKPDGTAVRRLCFDQDHDFYPSVMNDGRVLYTRWEYIDIPHALVGRLFTMNPDGTEQKAFYSSGSYWPNRIFYAKPIPGQPTKFVGIITGHHGTSRIGELVLFDVAKGRSQAEGVVQRIPGWGKKVEPVLKDDLAGGAWPRFLHPYPLCDKYFIVSCQPTPSARWGVYLADVFDNLLLLREEEGSVLFEPIPLRKTPRPPIIPERVDLASREARVYLSDVYEGAGLKDVPRGTVKRLRVYSYTFAYFGTSGIEDYVGMDGPWDVRRILGTVPVAEDGSASFIVPANTPIAVQPLDAEGKALQLMRSWFTAMPGENVSCVGCHEHGNAAPLRVRPEALARKPARIEPWYGPARGFGWDREVQPVLDKYCVGCHNGQPWANGKTPPDLRRAEPVKLPPISDAAFPPSFYVLRRLVRSPGLESDPRVVPAADYHADANPLVQMLRKGHHNVRLDQQAWDRLITWIDLNTPAYGSWLEIPSARNNPVAKQCAQRRLESQRLYADVEEDAENAPALPAKPVTPVMPPPETPPAAPKPVPGWPFSAAEAKRRQTSAGNQRLEVELAAGVEMHLVLIPSGEFIMGDAAGYPDEKQAHPVRIERPFWMGEVEVTCAQYGCFDPAHDSGCENASGMDGKMFIGSYQQYHYPALNKPVQPVCRISWAEAKAFCDWLSRKTGGKFSLPTEAQWEWACRAGTDTAFNFGPLGADSAPFANLADIALLNLFPGEKTRRFVAVDPVNDHQMVSSAVGSFQANSWGVFDMHGNVAEWTASAEIPYPFQAGDTQHANENTRKIVRGGSWYHRADLARSGCRTSYWPWQRVFNVGFRVVRELD